MDNDLKRDLMFASLGHSKDNFYQSDPTLRNVAQRAFVHGAEWMAKKIKEEIQKTKPQ